MDAESGIGMIAAVDAQGWVPHGRSLGHPGRLEWWLLRTCPENEGEDELHVKGRTIVWSRGSHSKWQTLKSFTIEAPVVAACWATFHPCPSLHQPELRQTGIINFITPVGGFLQCTTGSLSDSCFHDSV
ncbi:hypothetical protein B566_EDAN015343 [Ephemera danica]|nr:hypothetical protein B566_EDAN015343 [Ephemera danica]